MFNSILNVFISCYYKLIVLCIVFAAIKSLILQKTNVIIVMEKRCKFTKVLTFDGQKYVKAESRIFMGFF